ncbi:MAG: hypothetical protein ACFCU5_05045 [Pleurocapsa sp.]
MNTSLYLPNELAQRLNKYINTLPRKTSKNRIIALALEQFLDRQNAENSWSQAVIDWQGVEGFELEREEGLLPLTEEVL